MTADVTPRVLSLTLTPYQKKYYVDGCTESMADCWNCELMKMTAFKQTRKLALRGYISPLKGTNSVLTTSHGEIDSSRRMYTRYGKSQGGIE
jgi:hypothetical protein